MMSLCVIRLSLIMSHYTETENIMILYLAVIMYYLLSTSDEVSQAVTESLTKADTVEHISQ